jgi:hypothetical protein
MVHVETSLVAGSSRGDGSQPVMKPGFPYERAARAAVLLDLLTLLDAPLTPEEERELAELQDCSLIEIALRDGGQRRSGEEIA